MLTYIYRNHFVRHTDDNFARHDAIEGDGEVLEVVLLRLRRVLLWVEGAVVQDSAGTPCIRLIAGVETVHGRNKYRYLHERRQCELYII